MQRGKRHSVGPTIVRTHACHSAGSAGRWADESPARPRSRLMTIRATGEYRLRGAELQSAAGDGEIPPVRTGLVAAPAQRGSASARATVEYRRIASADSSDFGRKPPPAFRD